MLIEKLCSEIRDMMLDRHIVGGDISFLHELLEKKNLGLKALFPSTCNADMLLM